MNLLSKILDSCTDSKFVNIVTRNVHWINNIFLKGFFFWNILQAVSAFHGFNLLFRKPIRWLEIVMKCKITSTKCTGKIQFPHSSGEWPETTRKLCFSTKLPHQEIRWNYGYFTQCLQSWKQFSVVENSEAYTELSETYKMEFCTK